MTSVRLSEAGREAARQLRESLHEQIGYLADRLGEEKRIGDGRVNFPLLIRKLKEHGYDGAITIEREISGEQQVRDVLYAKKFLEEIIHD